MMNTLYGRLILLNGGIPVTSSWVHSSTCLVTVSADLSLHNFISTTEAVIKHAAYVTEWRWILWSRVDKLIEELHFLTRQF